MQLRFRVREVSPLRPMRAESSNVASDERSTIDRYLDRVDMRLAALPDDVRADTRRELRLHIESLIAAHEELGNDRDAATQAALRQFGEPRAIASRLCRAWKSTRRARTSISPARFGLVAFGIAMALFLAILLSTNPLGLTLYVAAIDPDRIGWIWASILLIPLVVGAGIGRRFPAGGGAGAFLALSVLTVLTAPLGAVGASHGNWHISEAHTPAWFFHEFCMDLTPMFMIWLPIGTIAAATTGAMSKNRRCAI